MKADAVGRFGQPLQQAVSAPRWLRGRTWVDVSTKLNLESRFEPELVQALRDAGHQVEVLDQAYSDTMGHAGALVRHPGGLIEGAVDPRSDGGGRGLSARPRGTLSGTADNDEPLRGLLPGRDG